MRQPGRQRIRTGERSTPARRRHSRHGRHRLDRLSPARALADCGVDAFAVVRPGRERLVRPASRPIVWDLAEANSRSRLPARLDGVVHLAAPRNRWSARGAPLASHIRISVDAAARVFDAARTRGASRAVYVSSIAVAGPRDARSGRPAVAPAHPYAMTKRWGEELAIALRAQVRGVTIVRPGPVYGPGQSPLGLLARFAARLKRREPIAIAAPHGRLVSPVFVGDVVDVIVASLAQTVNVTMSVGGPRAYRRARAGRRIWPGGSPCPLASASTGASGRRDSTSTTAT